MSYSALPQATEYRRRSSIASSASSSFSYRPPPLELLGFEGPALSSDVESRPAHAESSAGFMSPVRPGTGSGASYEMVGNSSDDEEEEEGKENMRTGKAHAPRGISKGDDIASPGVLVPNSSQLRMQEDSTKHNHGAHQDERIPDRRSVDSKVLDSMDQAGQQKTLEMQLDGRADADLRQRGHVSDYHIQHRPYRSSHQLPPLPPAAPVLDLADQASGPSTSSDIIRPAFRSSQSFPQLPPPPVPEPTRGQHEHRPATSATNIGTDLFGDFDGVHFSPEQPDLRFSFAAPPPPQNQNRSSQRNSTPNSDSQRSANLVFYPAPVPAMLNLPPTLSKPKPTANNRLSRHVPENVDLANNRRSVAYPGAGVSGPAPVGKDMHRRSVASLDQLANRRSIANLPPALRASQFFDSQPMPPIVPEVKEDSAVATLDSILDASARAPPAAFTDHPMMGGSALPSQPRNRSSTYFGDNYRSSMAVTVKLHPGESPRSSMEDETREDARSHLNPESVEFLDSQQQQNRHSFASSDFTPATSDPPPNTGPGGGLPTTLLAELESRKAQQRSRNRTAASAFPAGIRSTLLELDAVAQVQKETRSKQKTHLAWEDPSDDHDPQDDDVPLGILFSVPSSAAAGQKLRRGDDDVPLGLLVKKEMEDAEPLSKRRERLRGQASFVQPQPRRFLDVPGIAAASAPPGDEEVEGETLRQRMKRLKEQKDFGTGTLGVEFAPATPKPSPPPPPPPPPPPVEVEETLGQRRRRLQREAAAKREAALLQQEVQHRRLLQQQQQQQQHAARPLSYYSVAPTAAGPGMMGMGMGVGAANRPGGAPAEAVLDPKQREVVERWRASVM